MPAHIHTLQIEYNIETSALATHTRGGPPVTNEMRHEATVVEVVMVGSSAAQPTTSEHRQQRTPQRNHNTPRNFVVEPARAPKGRGDERHERQPSDGRPGRVLSNQAAPRHHHITSIDPKQQSTPAPKQCPPDTRRDAACVWGHNTKRDHSETETEPRTRPNSDNSRLASPHAATRGRVAAIVTTPHGYPMHP